jgi:hypothetical protein
MIWLMGRARICSIAPVLLAACSFETVLPESSLDAQPTITPSECASQFTAITDASSRYYTVTTELGWREAETSCEALDAHLFTPDDAAELTAIRNTLDDSKLWIGAVQKPTSIVNAEWYLVTGAPLAVAWQNGKPDDGGSENGSEQAAALNDGGLDDESHTSTRGSICECDGRAVDSSVVDVIPAS